MKLFAVQLLIMRLSTMRQLSLQMMLIVVAVFASPLSTFALDLDQAKLSGLVGERTDGYLGAVVSTAEVQALVQDINQQRRRKYQEIAQKNGTKIDAVEALAGKKAIENTTAGHYIQSATGEWKKK